MKYIYLIKKVLMDNIITINSNNYKNTHKKFTLFLSRVLL